MGELRESIDPTGELPSSGFGFGDWPQKANILLDDICQTIVIKNKIEGIDIFSYEEYDKFQAAGLKGVKDQGKKGEQIMKLNNILLALIAIVFLIGCVTQKPERTYILLIQIEDSAGACVVVRTEAIVEKDGKIETNQDISPDTTFVPGIVP
jgi:hypothetical protein